MKCTRVEARSIDEAIDKAAKQQNVAVDQIAYKVIQTKKGIMSLLTGNASVIIDTWLKDEPKEEKSISNRDLEVESCDPIEVGQFIQEKLTVLLSHLLEDTSFTIDWRVEDQTHLINVHSDEMAEIIVKKRKLIESCEYILRKMVLKEYPGFRRGSVFLDVNSRRQAHKEEIVALAQEMSDRVCEKGQPIVMDNRSAYERRIIHLALQENNSVTTKSVGEGSNRKIMILPKHDSEMRQ